MQALNFVPQDYIKRKRARKANLLCAILAATVVVAMSMALLVVGSGSGEMADLEKSMNQRLAEAASDIARWKMLQDSRRALLERAEQTAQLMNPLPHSRVIAEVVQAVPPTAALTELHMMDQKVKVVEAAAPAKKAAGRRKKAAQVVKEKTETRLRLIGVAPTDVEVARTIAALSSSPLLEKVELAYSEDTSTGGQMVRRFEVNLLLRGDAARLAGNMPTATPPATTAATPATTASAKSGAAAKGSLL